jgi:hypothetical protein
MIFSEDNKFLLIKNLKVGGTSLEVELSKVLPNNAVVTPIYPKVVGHSPRNYKNKFYNHISYDEINTIIELTKIKSYVFVRNPYDIVLSDFFHKLQDKKPDIKTKEINKKDFLLDEVDIYFKNFLLKSTHKLYTKKNKVVVSKLLFYENGIENEINKILPLHGINKIKLITFEKQYRPPWAQYKNIFNKKQIKIINDEWSWEFKNLGYSSV